MDRVNPAGAVEYAYDDRGRRCTYDAYGREISLTATGRLSGCAYGNVEFAYGRLAGTDLLSEIAVMGGYVMTKRVAYAADRDLPVEIAYEKSDASLIAKRTYSHDALGRVSARTQTRGSAAARTDAFGYNARSELTSATLGSDAYAYAFDYIGNRSTATEKDASLSYVTNNLNQYTSRGEAAFLPLPENPSESDSEQSDRNVASPLTFSPAYDADGNATLVQTSTGTWSISYNGENRPVRFENASTQTVVECAYDSQGRRFEKKVTVAGTLTLHERYVYDGYLQIAAFDVSTDAAGTESFALKRVIFWDPEEPTATRPLAINVLGDNLYFPTMDLTKNVCELVDFYGDIAATYDYAPFGSVTAGTSSGSAAPANPFQWSSEFYDAELDLVYYNYRHYSPTDGRFLSRDPIEELGGLNLYVFCRNDSILIVDRLGGAFYCPGGCNTVDTYAPIVGYRPTPEQERYSAIAAAIAAGAVIMGPALATELSLTEISALSLAGKTVSELMRKIKCLRCKIQVHSAHHEFLAFDVTDSFPYVKFYECFRKHINIMCYIKGKRGSDIRKQIPYSKCLPRNG